MTTPERALELAAEDEAEALRYRAIERRHLDLADQLHARDFACYAEMHEERAAILRHYAEIMQAEVAAESYAHHSAEEIGYCKFYIAIDRGEQLIIKPKPLP